MQLNQAVNNVFLQLSSSLDQLSAGEYIQPCNNLSNNTVGQHVRHIIELFQCLENGYDAGLVNYEKRKRDVAIETDKVLAGALLKEVYSKLDRPDKEMILEASYSDVDSEPLRIPTNYYREVAYNLEHTIHHMALIRVGIREVSSVELPADFGVASSTIKYRKECAQ